MFRTQAPPPGSNLPPPPNIEPFGARYFMEKVWEQASSGDIGDAFFILGLQLLPFIAFTMVIATVFYLLSSLFLSIIHRNHVTQMNENAVGIDIKRFLVNWTIAKIGMTMVSIGIVSLAIGGVEENPLIMLIAGLLLIPGMIILFSVWYMKTLRS
jgi:hypothetical protein